MTTPHTLLRDKRILVTGVLNDASIAFSVARRAQEEGAEVVLTSFGRAMSLTQRAARRLPDEPRMVELDVTDPTHLDRLADQVGGKLDGVLHAIGFAPESCLGGGFLTAPWDDVAVALQISAYSLKSLATACLPLMDGGSIVGLDFDNSRVAWPVYDWMGVAKAAFEATARYLARDLGPKGVRVNLVAAGPLRTIAARSIPGFEQFEEVWDQRAPLGWNVKDAEPVASACVALLSNLFPATTGEVVHVDGGYHIIGA
jgi:meromycolic acid enoyl-[acyl-carrier-protein] reductase